MRWQLAFLALAPLLVGAGGWWMDDQQSYRPEEAPLLAAPATSVPTTGREVVPEGELKNPTQANPASLATGRTLFEINCAMCHGATSARRGPVGLKLNPPPPPLDPAQVQGLTDTEIFRAMTAGFGRMPPFQTKLQAQDRWHLVNYLRTRR